MSKFKIGDLIVCKYKGQYGMAHEYAICEVFSISSRDAYIKVKIVDYLDGYNGNTYIGSILNVPEKDFKIYNKKIIELI